MLDDHWWRYCNDPAALIHFLFLDLGLLTGEHHKIPTLRKYWFWLDAIGDSRRPREAPENWTYVEGASEEEKFRQVASVHHIFNNPFRPPVTKTCPHCKGLGKYHSPTNRGSYHPYKHYVIALPEHYSCEFCNGKGWIEESLPYKTCENCQGVGSREYPLDYHDYRKCVNCRGEGKILEWPSEVVKLAEVAYETGEVFALKDCLLEHGYPELAGHFGESTKVFRAVGHGCCPKCGGPSFWRHGAHYDHEKRCGECCISWEPGGDPITFTKLVTEEHPKGCWALDLILGKE